MLTQQRELLESADVIADFAEEIIEFLAES